MLESYTIESAQNSEFLYGQEQMREFSIQMSELLNAFPQVIVFILITLSPLGANTQRTLFIHWIITFENKNTWEML